MSSQEATRCRNHQTLATLDGADLDSADCVGETSSAASDLANSGRGFRLTYTLGVLP